MKKVCVIGGGISGLCVAYQLKKKGFGVTLLEKKAACGGNIQTERDGEFTIEWGPNSLLASEHLFELAAELNLTGEIAQANRRAKKRYILKGGKLRALPLKIVEIVGTGVFSLKTKLKLLREPFDKSKSNKDESVAAFFERRFGREIVDYALDPFVSGIYAGSPEDLSVEFAFPSLFKMEKDFGSVIRGSLFGEKEKPNKYMPKGTSRTVSFRNGMQTLTDCLAENLRGEIKTSTEVYECRTENGKWKIGTNDAQINDETFDAAVVAAPSFVAARLIENLDGELARKLNEIYHPPLAVVVSAYKKADINFGLDGFGFLVPRVENRKILGSLWSSTIFENRAPEDVHLLTTFIGGARNAGLFEKSDDELFEIARVELDSVLGLKGAPVFQKIKRWQKAIPQYNIGYETTFEAIEKFKAANKGVFFCSNFYHGVSVGDCIKSSAAASAEVSDYLNL